MPLEEILSANQQFLSNVTVGRAAREPRRGLAIVTCMDGRRPACSPTRSGSSAPMRS